MPRLRRVGAVEEEWEVKVEHGAPKRWWFGFRYEAKAATALLGARIVLAEARLAPSPLARETVLAFGGAFMARLAAHDPFGSLPMTFAEADAARLSETRPGPAMFGGEAISVRGYGATIKRRAPDGMIEEAVYTRLVGAPQATETRLRLLSTRYVDATLYLEED